MKIRIIKAVIGWLWKRYKYQMLEIVVGHDRHVHANPKKRVAA